MSVYDQLASQELMEKIASITPDDAEEAKPDEMNKTASEQRGATAVKMLKVGQIVEASRRVGRLRAEAEINALRARR